MKERIMKSAVQRTSVMCWLITPLVIIFPCSSFASGYTAYYRCKGTQEASITVKDSKLNMVVGLSEFNKQLDTYRFKDNGVEVVMQRAASDDNSEAVMSFIMPDLNKMTLLVTNNSYIIVKTSCWLTKTVKH